MTKLLVVLGATGLQGSSIINAVQKYDPACKIRGITRDTSSSESKGLVARGIEMVAVDRYSLKALGSAFMGATSIFVFTDFWQTFYETQAAPAPDYVALEHIAQDVETSQGRNTVDAAMGCLDTLEHFVLSSLPDEQAISNGKHVIPHYAAKTATVKYLQKLHGESHQGKTLWDVTSILWVGYYMENWFNAHSRPKKSLTCRMHQTGDQTYRIRTPMPPDKPLAIIATIDIGRYIARFLATSAPSPAPILAVSQHRTMAQMVAAIAATTGKNIMYEQVTPAQYSKEAPGIGRVLAKMYAFMDEFGYCSDVKTIGAEDLGIDKRELTTFEDFVKVRNWSLWF
ncbi:MAG: hypothetical protein Q9186_000850 [Xanthomendoza sp. 1 TL-2023]